jgi:hypothetical protein
MRVVGTLTTLPKRLPFIRTTLDTVLNQSQQLDALYLNIPYETLKGEHYDITPELQSYFDSNKIIVLNRCKDFGSITKILPTLEREQKDDTIIVTFDDDVMYNKDLVKDFVEAIHKYPDACVGTGGWISGSFPFMYESVHDKTKEVDWLEGKTSVAYQRKFFSKDHMSLLQHPFPKELSQHDDHIITYHISKNGAKRMVIKGRNKMSERYNIRTLDGISSNPFKYLSQVRRMVSIMKEQGHYQHHTEPCNTYGMSIIYTLMALIIITLIILIAISRKSMR